MASNMCMPSHNISTLRSLLGSLMKSPTAALGRGMMDATASEEHKSSNSSNLSLIAARLWRSRTFLNGRFLHLLLDRVVAVLRFLCLFASGVRFPAGAGATVAGATVVCSGEAGSHSKSKISIEGSKISKLKWDSAGSGSLFACVLCVIVGGVKCIIADALGVPLTRVPAFSNSSQLLLLKLTSCGSNRHKRQSSSDISRALISVCSFGAHDSQSVSFWRCIGASKKVLPP